MNTTAASAAANAAPQRYQPALVALHWVVALLIALTAFLALGPGGEDRRQAGLTIAGLPVQSVHMILGISVLILLVIRLVIRFRTRHPDWATAGSPLLDKIGVITHWALYFFVFATTITALILALQTNRLSRIFAPAGAARAQFFSGERQPGQFPPVGQLQPGQVLPGGQFQPDRVPPGGFGGGFRRSGGFLLRSFHGLSWALLLVLIHIGAALYHQFIRRDGLMGRMWFGKRAA